MDKKAQGESNREWGAEAEKIAEEYLIREGYAIREHNWRIGNHIEIDLIAEKNGVISFVEVKARKGDYTSPEEAVNKKKMEKMIRGGDIYLRTLPHLFSYSLDIITIIGTKDDYKVRHIKDAFLPPLKTGWR